ncbi:hypothetical protein L345_18314, partial [Ophiophagus hannah]
WKEGGKEGKKEGRKGEIVEARKEGKKEKKGRKERRKEGRESVWKEGRKERRKEGRKEGRVEGRNEKGHLAFFGPNALQIHSFHLRVIPPSWCLLHMFRGYPCYWFLANTSSFHLYFAFKKHRIKKHFKSRSSHLSGTCVALSRTLGFDRIPLAVDGCMGVWVEWRGMAPRGQRGRLCKAGIPVLIRSG